MPSRGPDDAALALSAFSHALLALRALEPKLLKAVDELVEAQKGLHRAGVSELQLRFGRELQTLIQMRRGEAFWDRPSPEPTPAALTDGR